MVLAASPQRDWSFAFEFGLIPLHGRLRIVPRYISKGCRYYGISVSQKPRLFLLYIYMLLLLLLLLLVLLLMLRLLLLWLLLLLLSSSSLLLLLMMICLWCFRFSCPGRSKSTLSRLFLLPVLNS